MSKGDSPKKATIKEENNGDTPPEVMEENITPAKPKSRKTKYIVIGVSVGLLVILLLMIFVFSGNSTMTAAKLIKQYAKNADYVTSIVETDDPDGIMGEENQYISKSSWDDSRLEDIIESHAGTVEVFRNEEDAKLREWYLNEVNTSCMKFASIDKYGAEINKGACDASGSYGTLHRNKTVILRLSRSYSKEQVSEYEQAFDKLIQKFDIAESDIPSREKIEQIKQQKSAEIEGACVEAEEQLINNLNTVADDFGKTIDDAAADISKADTTKLREDMEQFKNIPYFADRVAEWESKINDIDNKIAEQKAAEEAAIAAQKAAEKAARTKVLSAGQYQGGTDIEIGTYNITAISGSGNLFIWPTDVLRDTMVNEVMSAIEDDYAMTITNYKNAFIGSGYKIEIKGGLVLRFEPAF